MPKSLFVSIAVAAAALSATVANAQAAAPMPKGDAVKGAVVFNQCKVCHVVEPAKNRVGPTLYGVVGRKSGTVPGYTYSVANKNSGLIWTQAQLYTYLEAPQKVIKGTKMAFAGLKKPQDRADVIAFLATKK